MTDDSTMRFRLQQVLAYRMLCRSVRSSGRGNVFLTILFVAFAYYTFQPNAGLAATIATFIYCGLALAEIAVGLFKWFFPSAEGILGDALLLLLFAGLNLGFQGLALAAGLKPNYVYLFFGIILLSSSVRRFKNYADLRRAFADRPSREQLAWFDDLIDEIRHSDPHADELALDIPTRPHWKAKLLGTTAFFVAAKSREVAIAGPWDFELRPARQSEDNLPSVRLVIHDHAFKPCEIDEASLANYHKWMNQQSS